MSNALARQLEAYVAHRLPGARAVRVEGLDRIHGGASRETWRLRLHYHSGDDAVERRLILRRDPPGSCIETDRRNEFEAYRAFQGTDVPVPEVLWLEEDTRWLEHPFFVMEEIAGFEASPLAITQPPYTDHHAAFGLAKWTILGHIAAADPKALGLLDVMQAPALDACWARELDHWERVLDEDELFPQPIIRAAVRWLRRRPPPPPTRLGVVHGDFRTGNFLYDQRGGIHGILDWEMAHLGDPLEDLAWSFSPCFDFAGNGRAGSLLPREEAIRIWEGVSGRRAEPEALRWWEVFTAVKGQAIWVSSAKEFMEGSNRDPILGTASLMMLNRQDQAALDALGVAR